MSKCESKENIDSLVQKWIQDNKEIFLEDNKRLYRDGLFFDLHRHLGAPDPYLDYRLKSIPDLLKFYFSILNTIITSIILALNIYLVYTLHNNSSKIIYTLYNMFLYGLRFRMFISSLNNSLIIDFIFQVFWVKLIILFFVFEFIIFFVLKSRYGSSWGMYQIQKKTGLIANFRDLDIEAYYIATIKKLRNNSDQFEQVDGNS